MSGKLYALQNRLQQEKGKLARVREELKKEEWLLGEHQRRYDDSLEARHVIRTVAEQTQKQLEYHVSGLVTTALASVFDDPYEFVVEFVQRRNKTECDLFFKKGDETCNPLDASGGGPVDVASFALRVAFLSMEKEKSRRVLILDEPFRFVSPDLQHKCSQMLKEISRRLGLQVIMVSHAEDIIGAADKAFEVTKVGEVSGVEVL